MELVKYFKMGFQKYADFSSRSTRSEFWWFQLGYFLVFIPICMIAGLLAFMLMDVDSAGGENLESFGLAMMIFAAIVAIFLLGTFIPQVAITVRRIHDTGNSGWLYLLTMLPYIGFIAWVIFGVMETEPRTNKWGQVPGQESENDLKDTLVDFNDELI